MAWRRTNSPPGFPVNFIFGRRTLDRRPVIRNQPSALQHHHSLSLAPCMPCADGGSQWSCPEARRMIAASINDRKSSEIRYERLPSDAAGDLQQAIHYYLQAAQPEEF